MIHKDKNSQFSSSILYSKRRFINFRTFLVLFVACLCAVLCGIFAAYRPAQGLIVFIIFATLSITVVMFLRLTSIKYFQIVVLFVSVICFVVTFLNIFFTVTRWSAESINGEFCTVEGTVDSIVEYEDVYYILLKKITINGVDAKGKVRLYVAHNEQGDFPISLVTEGFKVISKSKLVATRLVDEGFTVNAKYKRLNVRYSSTIKETDSISFEVGEMPFMAQLRRRMTTTLNDALGEKYGGLAYTMLTGDKSGMSEEMRVTFGLSGIGHILAVSGLHIGFIATVLMWIFKKLHVGKIPISIFLNLFFVFYAFMAGFSPSIIRAIITFDILLLSRLSGKWRDSLSSLAFAGSLILLVSPFSLFDAGFILSFSAVFSLILFTKPIMKILKRLKVPRFIANIISASVAVQFGVLPAIVLLFGEVQIYSVLTNMLVMPIIGVVFSGIFVSLTLALVIPAFKIIIGFFGIGLIVVDHITKIVAMLPFSYIAYSTVGAAFIYICIFFTSRFYMAKRKISIVKIVSVLASCALLFNGVFNLPKWKHLNNILVPINDLGSVTSVVRLDNKTFVVGDCTSNYALENTLKKLGISKVNSVYLTSLNSNVIDTLVNLSYRYKVDAIYIPVAIFSDIEIISQSGISDFTFIDKDYSGNGFSLVYDSNNEFVGFKQSTDYINILHTGKYARIRLVDLNIINECAIIRTRSYQNKFEDRIHITQFDIYMGESVDNVYSTEEMGDFVFDFSTGAFYSL